MIDDQSLVRKRPGVVTCPLLRDVGVGVGVGIHSTSSFRVESRVAAQVLSRPPETFPCSGALDVGILLDDNAIE